MGRAFNRMEKRVAGRTSGRDRYVRQEERLRSVEIALLELLHYVTTNVATDKDSAADLAVVQASADYESTLERTVRSNGR